MDNEDMRTISLGDPQLLLPLDEFEVSAPQKEGISDWALEIVFAILESRKQQKPLLVKMPSVGAENVMADVFRILPSNLAVECPFTTNYHLFCVALALILDVVFVCVKSYKKYRKTGEKFYSVFDTIGFLIFYF